MSDSSLVIVGDSLSALVSRAKATLAKAETAAEVLEAQELAGLAYDAMARAARLARAKGAHDELIGAVYRLQADALAIEVAAKRRLADEYDAAQARGEVATRQHNPGSAGHVPDRNMPPATAADLGLSRKQIHEARMIRDVEAAEPGAHERAAKELAAAGNQPTRAAVRRALAGAPVHGARIKVPPGMTAEELCRAIMRDEAATGSVSKALEGREIAAQAYRQMRYIVSLVDLDDLSPREAESAAAALAAMNESRQVGPAFARIRPLIDRIYGRPKGRNPDVAAKARKARFDEAFGVIVQACSNAKALSIPHMPRDAAERRLGELKKAIADLGALRDRLKELHQ